MEPSRGKSVSSASVTIQCGLLQWCLPTYTLHTGSECVLSNTCNCKPSSRFV